MCIKKALSCEKFRSDSELQLLLRLAAISLSLFLSRDVAMERCISDGSSSSTLVQ